MLFADVVHSMDIAAAVGAERLREIMAELLDTCAVVVKRYGGSVNQFTGDGFMAVFGAPVTLEDHAFRACLTALAIQTEMDRLSREADDRDGITLQLRIGLNSGRVIAGEVGSTTTSYTTIGEHVGLAQRMESVAPPGGVMLSESTSRLVENSADLGETEMVTIKGGADPVKATQLRGITGQRQRQRSEPSFVGRTWELNTITGILGEAVNGAGCVIGVLGPPGIGKSRLVREAATVAEGRGIEVIATHCDSHAADIPFYAVSRLLRTAMHIDGLDAETARASVRDGFLEADPEDLLLLDDLLGIRDFAMALPDIASDARRRRLTALINSASLARSEPALYVIEDVHWIDEASESLLADFLAVIPQIRSLTLITYRPEYRGTLTRIAGAQTLSLRPLTDAHASALTAELLGQDSSVTPLAAKIAERAAGNPFFVEEIVRDLAERDVLQGHPGAYQLRADVADVEVPATLQATIGARIDRLEPTAKRTLNAATVIGSRFDIDLLDNVVGDADVTPLIEAELVDQVMFTPRAEYAFRHPLIRTVAYESQLKSDRAELHRLLAATIEARGTPDPDAALIAEHQEAAGDLHAAFDWHMRAGSWSNIRDNVAAETSWRRAREVADRLPDDDPDRVAMRIAPRTLLCANATRSAGSGAETGFDELRELCTAAGDKRSLAIGMAGEVMKHYFVADRREASRLATEHIRLLESIDDPTLLVALLGTDMAAKYETGELAEVLLLAQCVIDLSAGDATKGNVMMGSPLALYLGQRSLARWSLGMAGWREDIDQAIAIARTHEPVTRGAVTWYTHTIAIVNGVLEPSDAILRETEEALPVAEQCGQDVALGLALSNYACVLLRRGQQREQATELLAQTREMAMQGRYSMPGVAVIDTLAAEEKIRLGELDEAIELARTAFDDVLEGDSVIWSPMATSVLVDALLKRGTAADLREAEAAVDKLAALATEPGFVLKQIWLLRLRALLAQAHGDDIAYRDHRDRYREMAQELGFEGHMATAAAMD